jgi:uncharacterized protein with PQ loop repeat
MVGAKNTKFYDIIGIIRVSCETFIELPQIKENCITKDTRNISGIMVLIWFIGDFFKTIFNIIYKSPMQMVIGGIIINCEDIILITQMILYNENSFLNKLFKRRNKYVNLDDVKNSEESNKIDFDTTNYSRVQT